MLTATEPLELVSCAAFEDQAQQQQRHRRVRHRQSPISNEDADPTGAEIGPRVAGQAIDNARDREGVVRPGSVAVSLIG